MEVLDAGTNTDLNESKKNDEKPPKVEEKSEIFDDNDKTINSLVDIDQELEEKARRRAREKGSMLAHLILFAIGNIALIIYNAITDWKDWWFLPISLGWTIGLIIHFLSTYLFNGIVARYVEDQTEKELEKISKNI